MRKLVNAQILFFGAPVLTGLLLPLLMSREDYKGGGCCYRDLVLAQSSVFSVTTVTSPAQVLFFLKWIPFLAYPRAFGARDFGFRFTILSSQVSISHSMETDVRPYLEHNYLPMAGEKIRFFAVRHQKGVKSTDVT